MTRTNRYTLINKRTGTELVRGFNSRATARSVKAARGYIHRIYDNVNNQFVR